MDGLYADVIFLSLSGASDRRHSVIAGEKKNQKSRCQKFDPARF